MRASGILLHITSLPSPYGVGTMGKEAYRFVDFLKESSQSYWQVLPVLTTGYGDSPYQSFSTFAGNPYLIDLDMLSEDGLLQKSEYEDINFGDDPSRVDFGKLFAERSPLLRKAYARGFEKDKEAFDVFCAKNSYWMEDYGLYMALKEHFEQKSYHFWPLDIRHREDSALQTYRRLLSDDVRFYQYVQFLFFGQWMKLKSYANANGIQIIGDIPIYVADDSADTWSHKELFWLDIECQPVKVAGVPPDGFTSDGQLWGNPLYLWDVHKEQNYDWWHRRILASLEMYDVVRIDHFRGFESFYAVPAGETTARNGVWMKGPGLDLFSSLTAKIKGFRIIAEDLGYMDDSVRQMLADSGFPGMKIMLFGFDAKNETDDAPYKHMGNCVAYIGTHDNETFIGWIGHACAADKRLAKRYMSLTLREGYNWGAIRTLMGTGAELVIMQMQDILGLDNSARMNTPSTLGGNWQWRLIPDWYTPVISKKLRTMTKTYARLPVHKKRATPKLNK